MSSIMPQGGVNSAVKRKYGSWVRSRAWGRQFREIVAKHFIYNIDRALKFLAFPFIICVAVIFKVAKKGFLQSYISVTRRVYQGNNCQLLFKLQR